MNTYLLFILFVIIFGFFLELLVSTFNLRAMKPLLPAEFEDVYDVHQYKKSQAYTQATTVFGMIKGTFMTGLTLIFILIGGFNWIDGFARGFGMGTIITGLIFTTALFFLSGLAGLPFTIYATFGIEKQFGFNNTTVGTFILDMIKGIVILVVLGGPVLALVLWFFEKGGPWAWVYCWVGVVAITLIIQWVAPVLIMPWFNKFTPLEEGELKKNVSDYAAGEQFRIKGIYTMDGSKRSTKVNAFFTGFGRFRRIVFFDTLVEKLTTAEIIAVLAHEMGHYKLGHIYKIMIASMLQLGLTFLVLSWFINNPGLFAAFKMESVSIYASLIFFGFLYSPISTVLSVFFNMLSRRHEFQADGYARQSIGQGEPLIEALKKLSRNNLSNLTPHPLYVFIHYSHPPLLVRIQALRNT